MSETSIGTKAPTGRQDQSPGAVAPPENKATALSDPRRTSAAGRKPATKAAEPRRVADGIGEAFDAFMDGFEEFRSANDRRLAEIERKMAADPLTEDRVERINRALDEQKRHLDQLLLKKARPPLALEGAGQTAPSEEKAAFEAYVRRGDDQPLRALEAKAYAAGATADGGLLVPPEVDTEIQRRLAMISPIRALATVRRISGAVLKKPFSSASLSTGWVAEAAARPQTNTPAFVEMSFPTMELYAAPAATQALLDDAALDIEAWIASEVQTAFAEQEGAAFINGDGVSRPKGLLGYTVQADATASWGTVGAMLTGAQGGFRSTNPSDTLYDLVYLLKAGYRQNGRFLMSRKTQGEVRKFKDTTGAYLWQPPAAAGQAASLMGFPVIESEDMPDMATNANAILFADIASAYLIVDRVGVRVLRDPYSAKPYVIFYMTKRVGGGIQNFEAVKVLRFASAF